MTFAWPCLLSKKCVDPATKYHGHLLLSHIITKFAIHKPIVLQVFHSLLKAHAVEARTVVRQALEILTPAMPGRMEDGNGMLTHWTKKIIVEEGHTVAQLVHILQLVVRHFKVYYPVRHHLIPHMVNSLHKLSFTSSASIEHRKLAVDLAEVVIKWEIQRIKDNQDPSFVELAGQELSQALTQNLPVKRSTSDSPQEAKRSRHSSGASTRSQSDLTKPIEKNYCDAVVNFLLRIACQVNETPGSPGEILSRRCVGLLKMALRPDIWPSTELKLVWFDKLLTTVKNPLPNFNNICTALELLSFLLTILKKETILTSFKPLQRGIAACMTCPNTKVIRGVHSLLSRLMSFFPTEPVTSNVASKYEELECLYACVSKVVYEGLTNYEKASTGSPSQLFSTLMILKAACMHNHCYIDRLITTFMKVLHKMAREHLVPTSPESSPVASELMILSLDLVKNRVGVMSLEMRKSFIGQILVGLIEKTTDAKVMKAITKMVEDWVKTKTPIAINQSPSIREKAILLVKLMQHVEKRFPDEQELNAQFLELVNYIYRDESLSGTELTSKLESAFLSGLRCNQPTIRHKFVEVFENSIPRRMFDRLLYITCTQNWEAMGTHFWIKQCVELLLSVAMNGHSIQSSSSLNLLPSASSIVNLADSQDRAAFQTIMKMKEEPMDVESVDSNKEEEEIDMELSGVSSDESIPKEPPKKENLDPRQNINTLLQRQAKFLESCREVKTVSYLNALSQLCHTSTDLGHASWVDSFPQIWKILSDKQQQMLGGELIPFMCSGSHVIQKDCHPSSIHTFLEGLSHCVPPVHIRPCVLKYLGRTHNLWHRACLQLEQIAFENSPSLQVKNRPVSEYEFEPVTSPQQETLDGLCELYSLLKEEDMCAGLWQKRAKFAETNIALSYEQHGFFEQAQASYEQAMSKARSDHNSGPASPSVLPEYRLWEERWIRCSKELNQWDLLKEYAGAKGNTNPHLVLESAWRVPNWALMKDALAQVELSCPKEMAWKVNLYRGYIAICQPDDHHLNTVTMIERLVEVSSNLAIKEWRRLPSIVSHIHVPLLQAAQQIMELQEAAQINQGLQPANITRSSSLHDMKAIVKTWRNRLPMIS
ncbi:transformation/transcription domain-associated protein-like [Pecten maximus]|uniref:transformation/transcription domain-associated protein-like n=1 Tax=Pecten maximus TaxID=6579 RepID=UPI001458984C|nr:transformation/transcription domain-associated protein-like [Pecten maximus]